MTIITQKIVLTFALNDEFMSCIVYIRFITQSVGEAHTITVHRSISTGKEIKVFVRPNFLITHPVPRREKAKEIEFVTFLMLNVNRIRFGNYSEYRISNIDLPKAAHERCESLQRYMYIYFLSSNIFILKINTCLWVIWEQKFVLFFR